MFAGVVSPPHPLLPPPLTMLIRSRIGNGSFEMSWPATHACPDVGRRRVHRILMRVVFPAPFGPRSPNSSPWWIRVVTRSSAMTGPSLGFPSPFGFFFRFRILRGGLTPRPRSRVSIARSIVRALRQSALGRCLAKPEDLWGSDGRKLLSVRGHVAGDPVPHPNVLHVRELGDLLLVMLEVRRELVRVLLEQLDGDPLDVGRPYVSQVSLLRVRWRAVPMRMPYINVASGFAHRSASGKADGELHPSVRIKVGMRLWTAPDGARKQRLNRGLLYAPEIRADTEEGGSHGRVAGKRRVPEEFEPVHRADPERDRREARGHQQLLLGGPLASRHRPAGRRGIVHVITRS